MVQINVKVEKAKKGFNIITIENFTDDEIFDRLKLMESMRNGVITNMGRIKTQKKRIPAIVKQVREEISDATKQLPALKKRQKEMFELINIIRESVKENKYIQKLIKEMDSKKLKPSGKIMDDIKTMGKK